MTCRTPSRCRACEHSDRNGSCALEAEVDLALAAVQPHLLVHARMRALA